MKETHLYMAVVAKKYTKQLFYLLAMALSAVLMLFGIGGIKGGGHVSTLFGQNVFADDGSSGGGNDCWCPPERFQGDGFAPQKTYASSHCACDDSGFVGDEGGCP